MPAHISIQSSVLQGFNVGLLVIYFLRERTRVSYLLHSQVHLFSHGTCRSVCRVHKSIFAQPKSGDWKYDVMMWA